MNQLPAIADIDTTYLNVYGARVHNLKNMDIAIPRNKMVVITGISGSGKSSLAFDTIYAEGQRRYMESLSAYARQFIGSMERPDVEQITGLSPVIAIEQKTTNKNPRSTVGTITEIYDFLRLLFARISEAYSYVTNKKMVRFTTQQIVHHIYTHFLDQRIAVLAPVVRGRKGHYRELFEQIRKQGYTKVRIDGDIQDITEKMQVDRYKVHDIEVVIDRIPVNESYSLRLSDSLEQAMKMGNGLAMVMHYETGAVQVFSKSLMCPDSGISYQEPSPNTFSFNSPYGACPACKGLGYEVDINLQAVIPDRSKSIEQQGIVPLGEVRDNHTFGYLKKIAKKYHFTLATPIEQLSNEALNYILYANEQGDITDDITTAVPSRDYEGVVNSIRRYYESKDISDYVKQWAESFMMKTNCNTCYGSRLKKESLYFRVADKNIAELVEMDIDELHAWFVALPPLLSERQQTIAKDILKEINERLGFLLNVGLGYLTLGRQSRSLSGGESQRIRLATQIGSQLVGITYILDEPSIGLHQRDNHQLIEALQQLSKVGNTVLVVEHDRDIMLASDYLIDIGPAAGKHGGQIVGQGTPAEFLQNETLTAAYLRNELQIPIPLQRRKGKEKCLRLVGANGNNLKNVTVDFPLGTFIAVTGVSGSGKSTLVNETLYPILSQHFYKSSKIPLPYQAIEGLENVDKVIDIDQAPIGRTPRSNPATYLGVFTPIRELFAKLPEAQIRGYSAGRFSFNVKGGRCEVCEGGGMRTIEMNFLPDVYVQCEKCFGKRYNRETLEVRYKGKSISDVLDMTVDEAVEFFEAFPKIKRMVKTLQDVGLGYITLGQPATTLSGGEAQRVKLSSELYKKDTGNTIYILDEPTTGLHFEDVRILLEVLNRLVDKGNTIIVIEHHTDMIKAADYIIDMGPEGGSKGGTLVAAGTPEVVKSNGIGHTAVYL
ncbi:MAG: excinuclease ABC subunit UvrA [Chitinophagales bacterium]|nr:excinuclease ABC subunit UvrA [Chitinophagales bacterium]